jgi:hypothetical protein
VTIAGGVRRTVRCAGSGGRGGRRNRQQYAGSRTSGALAFCRESSDTPPASRVAATEWLTLPAREESLGNAETLVGRGGILRLGQEERRTEEAV